MPILRVALAQINPRVGDLRGNRELILVSVIEAYRAGADLIAVPEMALTGYPIEDLAIRPGFLQATRRALDELALEISAHGMGQVPVVVGFAHGPLDTHNPLTSTPHHAIAHNSAAVLQDGRVIGLYNKHHLPNYSVFDEYRNFVPGSTSLIIHVAGCDVGLAICEDIWRDAGPLTQLADARPGMLLVINGSPFERDKQDVRLPLVAQRAEQLNAPVAYLNLVGGQDDLVFDGDSFVVDAAGRVCARAAAFTPDLLITDLVVADSRSHGRQVSSSVVVVEAGAGHPLRSTRAAVEPTRPRESASDSLSQVWQALVLGLGDYVRKNGFPSVILGLSGGIDSAVCAALAVDALGPDRVFGVSMPSTYSSEHSRTDAEDLAERLGISLRTEPISPLTAPVEEQLHLRDVAAENLQARMRGVILMGLSNAEGHLVLTTGNKSEIAVGYSTIYGDSVGGFAPIRDVPKSLVWELARWRNARAREIGEVEPIPENSITKAPSAELRPGQTDQDSLPPYDELDAILEAYITQGHDRDAVVARGFEPTTVDRILALVDRAEWKRRQGAIGPKISEMAFGRDRRLPVTYHRS
jgi:NAD+ synthase (glutamine-hydrolysing)